MQKLTIDIREEFKDGLTEAKLDNLLASHADGGYQVNQIYCTDPQRDAIKGFSEKVTDKKTKKVSEVEKYAGITLTVE